MPIQMPTVVLGVIGSDAHVVGVTILEHALKESDFDVVNLGAQTPAEEFAESAAEYDADAVLVSSMNGHAKRNCDGLHEMFAARGIDPITLVGGNLTVGQTTAEDVRDQFLSMGFDYVFESGATPEETVETLKDALDYSVRSQQTDSRARVSSNGL